MLVDARPARSSRTLVRGESVEIDIPELGRIREPLLVATPPASASPTPCGADS